MDWLSQQYHSCAYFGVGLGVCTSPEDLAAVMQVDELKKGDAVVLGVFKGSKSAELSAYLAVADAQRDSFSFGHTTDVSLAGMPWPQHVQGC